MEVTMLLCDAAQSVGGKLYILGGGFSTINASPGGHQSMALAIKIEVPWDQTNRKIKFELRLKDDDGQPVDLRGQRGSSNLGPGDAIAGGEFEVGRPPGMKPGTPIDVPLVIPFAAMQLRLGGYVWELDINGTTMARIPFRLQPAPGFSPDQFQYPEAPNDDEQQADDF